MDNTIDVTEVDSVVKNVIQKFLQRSNVGKLKYGIVFGGSVQI